MNILKSTELYTFKQMSFMVCELYLNKAVKQGPHILCSFSIHVITNYHKLSGLNHHRILSYSSVGQKSDMGLTELKSMCLKGCVCFWKL